MYNNEVIIVMVTLDKSKVSTSLMVIFKKHIIKKLNAKKS